MLPTQVNTVVVGAGQAGLAMSAHLSDHNIDHLVLERASIAESWRNARWDSLVMNGPAWHDRFPTRNFIAIRMAFLVRMRSLAILKISPGRLVPQFIAVLRSPVRPPGHMVGIRLRHQKVTSMQLM